MDLKILKNYIPNHSYEPLQRLISNYSKLTIKITNGRKSKWGDYRYYPQFASHQITINGNLNPYAFLITFLHEVAHLEVRIVYGQVKPHGIEWKTVYRNIFQTFLETNCFPDSLSNILRKHLQNPKAAISSDIDLFREIRSYNTEVESITIMDLPDGVVFRTSNGEAYLRIKKIQKRIACTRLRDNKKFIFSPLVPVFPLDSKNITK